MNNTTNQKRQTNPVKYPNFKTAAKATGLKESILRAAKRAGCPAFRHSKIYVKELLEWLKTHDVTASAEALENIKSLQIRKLLAECLAKERENQIADSKLVSVEEVEEINSRVNADICRAVKETFTSDAHIQSLLGCSCFAEMKERMTQAIDKVFARIHGQ